MYIYFLLTVVMMMTLDRSETRYEKDPETKRAQKRAKYDEDPESMRDAERARYEKDPDTKRIAEWARYEKDPETKRAKKRANTTKTLNLTEKLNGRGTKITPIKEKGKIRRRP